MKLKLKLKRHNIMRKQVHELDQENGCSGVVACEVQHMLSTSMQGCNAKMIPPEIPLFLHGIRPTKLLLAQKKTWKEREVGSNNEAFSTSHPLRI